MSGQGRGTRCIVTRGGALPASTLVPLARALVSGMLCCCAMSAAQAADTMRAVVAHDGKVELQTVPKPVPKSGEIRIRVRAASVNPVDWKLIDRLGRGEKLTPGRDLSGVVDAVGDANGPWKVGQAVIAIAPGGSYSEYVISPVNVVALKPEQMSFEEASGIPIVGETAWRAVVTVANVQPGQKVLVQGGAGGVGSSAVQIAKSRGAYVIATASPRHNDLLRSLGADEILDYNTVRFEDKLKNIDVVVNTVDADTGLRSVRVVKPGGVVVTVVADTPADACAAAKVRCASTGRVTGEMVGQVSALAAKGKFHVKIEQTLPLADAAKALDLNRKGHVGGKLVLEVSR
ncbi:MAG TPA: NADP-dependent oxidoreductase [Steroidobacteraceae bacterium]